ncbi:MAG: hypothetical protein M3Y71_13010 [Actinomycetota bacterium]|nr:hypothetical protein [Actinomycetota bacterium]
MTLHSVLTATSAVVHPHAATLTVVQVAVTVGAGGVAAVLLRGRARLSTRPSGGMVPATVRSPVADSAGPAVSTRPSASPLTCRPQLLTPPGTARARDEVEQWLARGELDIETYRDLRHVFAEVEAAARD